MQAEHALSAVLVRDGSRYLALAIPMPKSMRSPFSRGTRSAALFHHRGTEDTEKNFI